MEMSAKSGLSLCFRYLVFFPSHWKQKVTKYFNKYFDFTQLICSLKNHRHYHFHHRLLYFYCLCQDHLHESRPLFIVSHHTEIHPACARFILMKINDADLLLSLFIVFFLFRSFQVHPLAPHMRPVRKRVLTDTGNSSGSPFIFSTLRQNRKEARKVKRKQWLRKTSVLFWYLATVWHKLQMNLLMSFFFHPLGVKWVCGDIGQVSLDVFNPMPFELKATNMVSSCGL